MKRNGRDTLTVSFRIDCELYRLLAEAADRLGLSPGEYARSIVRAALLDEHSLRILDDLAATRRDLAMLKQQLRLATVGLMIQAGDASEEEAEKWVADYFGSA